MTHAAASLAIEPLRPPAEAPPRLFVTVDVEEAFDWKRFTPRQHEIDAPEHIAPLQALCAEAGAKPLYFLTYPMLTDAPTRAYFRTLFETGAADAGVHAHPWATPPYGRAPQTEEESRRQSYLCNLAPQSVRQKLSTLNDAFEQAMGARALAHRAGRYGLALSSLALLAEAGLKFDFSPSAGFDLSADGGPDFSGLSSHAFRAGGIVCLPASGARALRHTPLFLGRSRACAGAFARPTRLPRWTTAPLRLSPEGARLSDLKRLTRSLLNADVRLFSLTLHSTSLAPKANPYSETGGDIARTLDLTRRYLDFFRTELGGAFASLETLQEIASTLR